MKQFIVENNIRSVDAEEILETIHQVMHCLRDRMRTQRSAELSLAQLRVLGILRQHGGASLNDLADHLGLMPPTVSKLIETLVQRHYVTREVAADDRRRMVLHLTDDGWDTLRLLTQEWLVQIDDAVTSLSPEERAAMSIAMASLKRMFPAKHCKVHREKQIKE